MTLQSRGLSEVPPKITTANKTTRLLRRGCANSSQVGGGSLQISSLQTRLHLQLERLLAAGPRERARWSRQRTTRTQRMTYEWEDSDGVQHVTAWSKAVRNAMLRGGAEYQKQRVLDRAGTNWNKNFLISADVGWRSIRQSASAGARSDLMDTERWGRRCMLQLQEAENWNKPAATSWAAEFLSREGESRECLGPWINSSA